MRKRNKSKRRKVHNAQKRRNAKFLISFFVVIASAFSLVLTPLFNLKYIQINGTNYIMEEDILNASAFNMGENLFKQDIKRAKKEISQIPFVEDVKIIRYIPSSIKIYIKEGQVNMYIPFLGKLLGVNEDFKILNNIPYEEKETKPIILGISPKEFMIGENIIIDEQGKFDIIKLYEKCFKDNDIYDKITYLDITNTDDVKIVYNEKLNIEFGKSENINYKVQFFKKIIEENIGTESSGTLNLFGLDNKNNGSVTFFET